MNVLWVPPGLEILVERRAHCFRQFHRVGLLLAPGRRPTQRLVIAEAFLAGVPFKCATQSCVHRPQGRCDGPQGERLRAQGGQTLPFGLKSMV